MNFKIIFNLNINCSLKSFLGVLPGEFLYKTHINGRFGSPPLKDPIGCEAVIKQKRKKKLFLYSRESIL